MTKQLFLWFLLSLLATILNISQGVYINDIPGQPPRSCLVAQIWLQTAYDYEGFVLDLLMDQNIVPHSYRKPLSEVYEARLREIQRPVQPLDNILDIFAFVQRMLNVVNPLVTTLTDECYNISKVPNPECLNIFSWLEDYLRTSQCSIMSNDGDVLKESMLRAFKYHPFKTEDLFNGRFGSYKTSNSLTCSDLWSLMKDAYMRGQFKTCHRLIESFHRLLQQSPKCLRESCIRKVDVVNNLKAACWKGLVWSYEKHLHVRSHITHLTHLLYSWIHPLPPYSVSASHVNQPYNELYKRLDYWDDSTHFSYLCRGEGPVIPDLYCYYTRPMSGYYRVKTELLSNSPFVYRFLEVVHPIEMETVKSLAKSEMQASTLLSDTPVDYRIRLSGTAWLYDYQYVTGVLSRRISFITGFLTHENNAEAFQVVNYGIAGYYDYHYDALYKTIDPNDRIATWLYYLDEPLIGGYTAFPQLRLGVAPIKGSAVLWHNLLRNGSRDERSVHAGCPVIVGQKWIANKWIKVGGQFQTRKCSINPEDIEFSQIY